MEIRILITTAPGYAKSTEFQLQPFILGASRKVKHTTYCNEEDNKIVWEVEGPIRRILKVNKNVGMFDVALKKILSSKTVHGAARLSRDQRIELKEMLKNHTTVEVIKKATAEELDVYNKSLWQRIKSIV